jgi:hypothetical protein
MTRPSRLLTWLLWRFAVDDALVGDLHEECGRGRSAWWCWRQALVAIASLTSREVQAHARSATAMAILGVCVIAPLYSFEWRNFGNLWLMRFPQVLVGFAAFACVQGAVAGLFVARLSPAQPLPMVMTVTTVVWVASIIVGASALQGAPAPVPAPLLLFWIAVSVVLTPVGIVAGGLAGATERAASRMAIPPGVVPAGGHGRPSSPAAEVARLPIGPAGSSIPHRPGRVRRGLGLTLIVLAAGIWLLYAIHLANGQSRPGTIAALAVGPPPWVSVLLSVAHLAALLTVGAGLVRGRNRSVVNGCALLFLTITVETVVLLQFLPQVGVGR